MEIVATEWRAVQSNSNYEVSNTGKVRSKPRTVVRRNGTPYRVGERVLSEAMTPTGYRFVSLYGGPNSGKQYYIHRLVAEAFHGPCPAGYEVNHKDLDKANNSVGNLEYVTRQENMGHAHANGKFDGSPKFTPEQIRHGHALVSSGMKYADAARICGVKQGALESACRGVNWGHLGLKPIRRAPVRSVKSPIAS